MIDKVERCELVLPEMQRRYGYPSLWGKTFPTAKRTPDQQDAYATAEWLRRADSDGSLEKFLCPELEPHERKTAEIEGWILGVL